MAQLGPARDAASAERPVGDEELHELAGIEEAFRDFRESAVRLVERVNDALETRGTANVLPQETVRRIRSIFGKWSAEILFTLHVTPGVGFEELRRSLPAISPRVLSAKLKAFESHNMVRREILDSRPPRAKYTLTERGWTVAWLAQPVLLYLRLTSPRRAGAAEKSELPASPSPAREPPNHRG